MRPATTGQLILLLPAGFAIALFCLYLFVHNSLSESFARLERLERIADTAEQIPVTVSESDEATKVWRRLLRELRDGSEDRSWQETLNTLETARIARLEATPVNSVRFDKELAAVRNSLIEQAIGMKDAGKKAYLQAAGSLENVLFVYIAGVVALAICLSLIFKKSITDRLDALVAKATGNAVISTKQRDQLDDLDKVLQKLQTQLKESGAREKSMLENATDVICLVDTDGVFVSSNRAAKNILGFTPEELEGHAITKFLVPEDAESCLQSVLAAEKSIDKVVFENRWVRKDGTVADLLWSAHWSAKDGNLFCVVHDITERVEMERLKAEVAAMISHDLRTPLMSLQIILMLIEEGRFGQLNEQGMQTVARGSAEAARLISLIGDLLDVEKMRAGKFLLRFEKVALHEVAKLACDAVNQLAEAREVQIQIQPTEVFCEADRGRLIQVVVNLLSNAIKFAPAGSVVEVGISRNDEKAKVSVSDRGRGVPEEKQHLIFESFQQAEPGDQFKGGSGLGLAVCKAIVEQHDGQIGVASTPGQGSTFWFEVPCKRPP